MDGKNKKVISDFESFDVELDQKFRSVVELTTIWNGCRLISNSKILIFGSNRPNIEFERKKSNLLSNGNKSSVNALKFTKFIGLRRVVARLGK